LPGRIREQRGSIGEQGGGEGRGGGEKKRRKEKERKEKRQFLIRVAFYPPPVCGTARHGVVFRLLKGCTGTRAVHGFTP
jgi:hypothetical protein